MSKEFVAFDKNGKEISWVDPCEWHQDVTAFSMGLMDGECQYRVSNSVHVYEVIVPRGGHFEIREMEVLGE